MFPEALHRGCISPMASGNAAARLRCDVRVRPRFDAEHPHRVATDEIGSDNVTGFQLRDTRSQRRELVSHDRDFPGECRDVGAGIILWVRGN